jgi:hypothetical protein
VPTADGFIQREGRKREKRREAHIPSQKSSNPPQQPKLTIQNPSPKKTEKKARKGNDSKKTMQSHQKQRVFINS